MARAIPTIASTHPAAMKARPIPICMALPFACLESPASTELHSSERQHFEQRNLSLGKACQI